MILLAGRRAQRHNATINIAKNLGRVPQSDGQVFAQIRVFAVVEGWKGIIVIECHRTRVLILSLIAVLTIWSNARAQSFAVGRTLATPVHPNAVAIGDFNGDGHMDLAIPCWSPNSVAVFLANGFGGFGPAVSYAVGGGPRFAVVADFNGDGRQDIATANQESGDVGSADRDGTGAFQPVRRFSAGNMPYHLTVSDLNKDGRLDLAVANSGSNNLSILIGDGVGGFGSIGTVPVGTTPQAVVAADFDKDGNPDLAVSNYGSHDVWLVHGNGSGGFGPPSVFAVGLAPYTLAVADLNADGRPDLAVPNFDAGTVSILLGDVTAGLVSSSTVTVGTEPARRHRRETSIATVGRTSRSRTGTATRYQFSAATGGRVFDGGHIWRRQRAVSCRSRSTPTMTAFWTWLLQTAMALR